MNQMELFNALLLSLPGTPVLYYGDEIGMGDNIWLGDRDGVRTRCSGPSDRNAGFSLGRRPASSTSRSSRTRSSATSRSTSRPSWRTPPSLLHWMRRMIHARPQPPGLRLGTFHDLGG